MKTFYLILIAIICNITVLYSQITLSQADIVKNGTTMAMATDNLPAATVIPGPAGSGLSWNFSALEAELPDTINVVNPSSLPKNEAFPTATLGYMLNSDNDSVWGFMINDANGFRIRGLVGIDESTGDTIPVDLNLQLIKFPASLGSSFVSYNTISDSAIAFGFDPDGPGPAPFVDSIRTKIVQETNSNIDASGSLTTPFGTFNSLRQYLVETFTDSVFMYANGMWQTPSPALAPFIFPIPFDTNYSYRWWSNQGVGFPLVELSMDINTNSVIEAFWVADVPVIGTGVQELSGENVKIFPNPVNDLLRIENNESASSKYTFQLISLSGMELMKTTFEGKSVEIDLERFPAGAYFYSIQSDAGKVKSGKLILE